MRKLTIVTGVLVAVVSSSAVGVGASVHYNVGLPLSVFADYYEFSLIGFQVNAEITVHRYVNVSAAFGYQVFEPDADNPYSEYYEKLTIIPVMLGVEYRAAFGDVVFYPGVGASFNYLKEAVSEGRFGVWFGGNFYYMVNTKLGIGAGVTYNLIFTEYTPYGEDVKTSWFHIPVGAKYWFM